MEAGSYNDNKEQEQGSSDGYDLSLFENPDLSKFRPGPFLHSYNMKTKCGQVFDFDPSQIVFGPLEKRKSNSGSLIRLLYKNPVSGALEPLHLQTPAMPTIFGLSSMDKFMDKPDSRTVRGTGDDGKTQDSTYRVDLSFKDMFQLNHNRDTAGPELQLLEQFFHTLFILDQVVLNKAKESVSTWFAGSRQLERNPSIVDGFYKPLSAPSFSKKKQRNYAPAIRVKAAKTNRKFNFKIFSKDEVLLTAEDIKPDTSLTAVLEVTGIWQVQNMFGVGLRLVQAQISKPETIDTFCIAKVMPAAGPPLISSSQQPAYLTQNLNQVNRGTKRAYEESLQHDNDCPGSPVAKRPATVPAVSAAYLDVPSMASVQESQQQPSAPIQFPSGTFRLTGMK